VPGPPLGVEITGADLPLGETKVVEMPFNGQNAVCIEDTASAEIGTLMRSATCTEVFIEIPTSIGDSNNSDLNTGAISPYTVTTISTTHIRIEGLVHTAIVAILDKGAEPDFWVIYWPWIVGGVIVVLAGLFGYKFLPKRQ